MNKPSAAMQVMQTKKIPPLQYFFRER